MNFFTPHALAFAFVGLLSALFCLPATAIGRRFGFVQRPQGIPLTGGFALIAAWWISALVASPWAPHQWSGLALATAIIAGVGLEDARRRLRPGSQFLAQLIAATSAVFVSDIAIRYITNPFGGLVYLTGWVIAGIPVTAAVLSLVWIVALMNAMNFLDGIDGLAASVGAIGLLTIGAVSLLPHVNEPTVALPAFIAAGAAAGLLFQNLPPARLYLGTSGAWFLGFLLAVLSLQGSSKIATLAVVGAIPLLDATAVILGRLRRGVSPFLGDTTHLHHRLAACGWSPRAVLALYSGCSAILGVAAIVLPTPVKILLLVLGGAAVALLPLTRRSRSI